MKQLKIISAFLTCFLFAWPISALASNANPANSGNIVQHALLNDKYTQVARHHRHHRRHKHRRHRTRVHFWGGSGIGGIHVGGKRGSVHIGFGGSPFYYNRHNWYWYSGAYPTGAYILDYHSGRPVYACLAKIRGGWYEGRVRRGGSCVVYLHGKRYVTRRYMLR